jgi:hypothetical protein
VDLLCDVVDEASSTVLAIFWLLVVDVFFVGDKKNRPWTTICVRYFVDFRWVGSFSQTILRWQIEQIMKVR